MHPLEKKIQKLLTEKNIINRGEKLVVGVSAGPDSLCLLHVLNRLTAEFSFSLAAAYFDHGLRPAESAQEAELVRREAGVMGWQFYQGAGDVSGLAGKKGMSTEEAARTLRYNFLNEILADCGGQKIAVAHTADDQAEELLLRLIRGTGRKGLSGMGFVRDRVIVRPFLEICKEEILDYLKDQKVTFCTDSSNQQKIYLRNKVRLDLIPYLEKNFNPGVRKILQQTSSLLQEEENLLDDLCVAAYVEAVSGEKALELDLSFFARQHIAIQRRIIEKMLLQLNNSPGFRQINQVLYLADLGETGSCIHLGRGLRGVIEGHRFIFSYPQGQHTQLRGDLNNKGGEDVIFDLDINEPGLFRLDRLRQVEVLSLDRLPVKAELSAQNFDYFDQERLTFPFKVRNRMPGDRFHPLGSPGHKKVGDFLTDLKLAENIRKQVPVLVHDGEIAALLGIRISHQFRVQNSSSKVVRIRVVEDTC